MSQTTSPATGLPDATGSAPVKGFSNSFRRLASNRLFVAIVIFITAFALRAGHNLALEHRVWYFEDAQNYLRSGASIYRTVKASGSPAKLLENVSKDAKDYSGIYKGFDSDKLVDRMLTDGAVFPLYLAGVEAVSGLDAEKPQYESISLKVSMANSALDSLTCVVIFLFGALLFGVEAGALAGLLYALYPPAIVNTQWCMSETFCGFMLVLTVYSFAKFLTVPPNSVLQKSLAGAVTGVITGLTMLARSAFPLFVPLLIIASFIGIRSHKALVSPIPLIILATTLSLTLAPWLMYTQASLGQARLTSNRLPAFNVVSGNLASIDGYTPFPCSVAFPEGMKEAAIMVAKEAAEKPYEFTLLELKKIARLWSSVWNDCKYSVLGLNANVQNVFHQLLLFLALCWGFIVCARGKRRLSDGELLGTSLATSIIFGHFIFLAFIALSRYATTAMPFVVLMAASAVVHWFRAGAEARKQLAIVLASFIAISAFTNEFKIVSQFVCGLVAETWWSTYAPWLTAALAVGGYAGVWWIALQPIRKFTQATNQEEPLRQPATEESFPSSPDSETNTPLQSTTTMDASMSKHHRSTASLDPSENVDPPQSADSKSTQSTTQSLLALQAERPPRLALAGLAAVSLAVTSCGIIGSIVGSHTWSEWSCPLTNQEVHQTIKLPTNLGTLSKTGYVLIDIHDEEPLPELEVKLNDQVLNGTVIPIDMIQTDNDSILGSLKMQANSMNIDFRALRHWYAVPFPTTLLRPGAQNTITISNSSKTHPVTIYGDYATTTRELIDGEQILPSINSLSWNYAVEGSDYRSPMEPRLLESIQINGKTTESSLVSKSHSDDAYKDLSQSFGTQWGRYRVRLLVQPRTAAQLAKNSNSNATDDLSNNNNNNDTSGNTIANANLNANSNGNVSTNANPDAIANGNASGNANGNANSNINASANPSPNASSALNRSDDNSADTVENKTKDDSVLEIVFAQKPGVEHEIHGGNPNTFNLSDKPIPVNEVLLRNHPIRFTCELKTAKRPVNAFINLVFKTGIGDVWTPEWQPECVPADSSGWKKLTIVDSFPKLLLEHNGVSVQPIVTPFGKDLLFTQQKKAGRQAVLIRNAKLEILNTEIQKRSNLFTWKVY
jgi:hypothetical protein